MTRVGAYESRELNVFAVVFEDEETGVALEFQAPIEDREGELDYCLVMEAGPVAFGCVTTWSMDGQTFFLSLTEAGAALLSLPTELSFPYRVVSGTEHSVQEAMVRILGPAAEEEGRGRV